VITNSCIESSVPFAHITEQNRQMQQASQRETVAAQRLAWNFKSSRKVVSIAFTLVLLAFFFVAKNYTDYVYLYFLVFFAW